MGKERDMSRIFDASAEKERLNIEGDEFIAKYSRSFKIAVSFAAILSIATGILLNFLVSKEVSFIFLALGMTLISLAPSIFFYKCLLTKTLIKEEYYILFFKVCREIYWSDVAYRKITLGNNNSIKLYDQNRKKLISFDSYIIGYKRILRLAKRSFINDI